MNVNMCIYKSISIFNYLYIYTCIHTDILSLLLPVEWKDEPNLSLCLCRVSSIRLEDEAVPTWGKILGEDVSGVARSYARRETG